MFICDRCNINLKWFTDPAVASIVFCGIMDLFSEHWDTLRESEYSDLF